MIGLILGDLVATVADAARVLLMSREQERRWINADRGEHRPIYAPPITHHHAPWPHEQWPGAGQGGGWPYQQWPGSGGR